MIMPKGKNNSLFGFAIMALMLVSCNSNALFDEYKPLIGNVFDKDNPVEFAFIIQDTITPKAMFIQLRNNNNYAYSNLYLITKLQYPSGKQEIDTVQYAMADRIGNFLGSGLSSIKENKLCYQENCAPKVFNEKGEYTFQINQAMRKVGEVEGIQKLEGITDIGLKIEKLKE